MKAYNSFITRNLALFGAAAAIWAGCLNRCHGQVTAGGIGFSLDSDSYVAVQGGSISGTLAINQVSDSVDNWANYPDTPEYISDGEHLTDWYVHENFDTPTEIQVFGSGFTTLYQKVTFPVNAAANSTQDFTIDFTDSGSPGPDQTLTVQPDGYDPYVTESPYDGPYDDPIDDNPDDEDYGYNPYWYHCLWFYSDPDYYETPTATLTLYNPNTVMSVGIVGSSTLVETVVQESTTIRISRADSYNTRTVYYTITGNAQSGTDYCFSIGVITMEATKTALASSLPPQPGRARTTTSSLPRRRLVRGSRCRPKMTTSAVENAMASLCGISLLTPASGLGSKV